MPWGRTALKRLCSIAFGFVWCLPILFFGHAVAAPASTPGGAVPKEDPWTISEQEPLSIDIPRAAERPISAEEGPRVRVETFDLDIDPALEQALGADKVAQMRNLVESRRAEQPDSGLTIGQMEQVSAALTEFLRNGGFIVSYAFLPTQQVEDGKVTIGVLSGTLGAVVVEGNTMMTSERIRMPFNHLLGDPLRRDTLERAILNVRDYPGLAPSAVLSPGDQVGTTNLTLRVLERRFDIGVIADNYGSEETGDGRGRLRLGWNNPLGLGDRLTVNVLQTFSPSEGTFGGIAYELPAFWRGFSLGAFYDENTFDFDIPPFEVTGESKTGGLFGRQELVRSRELNVNMRLSLETKEASFDGGGIGEQEDKLSVATLGFDLEGVDRIGALGVNSLTFAYSHGFPDFLGSMDSDGIGDDGEISTRVGASGDRAGGKFDKVTLRYQRLQQINESNSLIFRAYGQYSDDLLTPLEQMTLGGPYSVRAYPTAEFLSDRGAFGSLEYTLNVTSLLETRPDVWDLNLSLFYDHAYGKTLEPLSSEFGSVDIGGVGAGVHYEYRWGNGNGILFRVEVATPSTNEDPTNDRDPQYWLRMEYFRR